MDAGRESLNATERNASPVSSSSDTNAASRNRPRGGCPCCCERRESFKGTSPTEIVAYSLKDMRVPK